MGQPQQSWLAAPNVRWYWATAAALLWSIAMLVVLRTDLGVYLESRISRPLDFRVRHWLGKDPELSNHLKIFSYDDSTFARLGKPSLTLKEWKDLFQTIAENKPRAIVIDGMFSLADTEGAELGPMLDEIRGLGVPIIIGSFYTRSKINIRKPLKLDRPEYSLARMAGVSSMKDIPPGGIPEFSRAVNWHAYGPMEELQSAFTHIGHFVYRGHDKVAPMVMLEEDVALGHLSMYAAKERRIENGKLFLDGQMVPIDNNGDVIVNFLPPRTLYSANKSLRGLLRLVSENRPSESIKDKDVVLILPLMFTGNTDFQESPFGTIPGGFVIGSMLNSVITGHWIKPLGGVSGLVFLMAALGALLGTRLRPTWFWIASSGIGVTSLVACFWLFSWHSISVSWLFPLAAFAGTSLTVFAEKTRVGEKKAQALRFALEGAVAPDELRGILKHPELISLEARERVVTLMFIDVVGFSLLAENMLPRMAFENLKKMLANIGQTVHEFGGIIDKTLGDGLLCYFGYRFAEDATFPDHAEKALRCAIRIQKENLQRNLEAAENGEPVYPLRIGINTSSCYLGDLGSQSRIDFTVVGNGVNFAKRLEGACEMHSVLMGATTYDLVRGIGLNSQAIIKRFIRIKHHSELVESYEYDPFVDQQDLRIAAIEGFRKCANIERIDQRWPVHDPAKIILHTDFGRGELVNFSHAGLSIRLPRLLVKGTRLNVTLDSAGGALGDMLKAKNITVLQGEVRWGYAEDNQYVHGVMVTNVTDQESDFLVQYLCEFAFSREANAADSGKAS